MKPRTIFLIATVLVLAATFLSPFLLMLGWNHGVVGTVDGVHALHYSSAILIETTLAAMMLSSRLFSALLKLFKILSKTSSSDAPLPVVPDPEVIMQEFMQAALLAQAAPRSAQCAVESKSEESSHDPE